MVSGGVTPPVLTVPMALDGTDLGGTDLGDTVPGDQRTGDPVLGDLQAATDRLYEVGPAAYAEGRAIRELLAHQARLGAFVAQAVAAFDASGAWSLAGARSATAWLRAEARLSRKDASGQVRRGRALRRLPEAAAAWRAGAITGDHVDLLAPLCSGTTEEALVRDEPVLVAEARTLTHDQFVRTLAYWRQLADPDGTDQDAEAGTAGRDAYLVSSFSGTWLGRLTLDPVAGAVVADELRRLEELLFEAEWAEARDRLGSEPTVAELPRTPGQRRADAFVEMARRSKTGPGRRPASPHPWSPSWSATRPSTGGSAELEDGTVVAPGALLPWLEGADIERAEYPGGSGGHRGHRHPGHPQPGRPRAAVFAPVTRGSAHRPTGASPGPPDGPSR